MVKTAVVCSFILLISVMPVSAIGDTPRNHYANMAPDIWNYTSVAECMTEKLKELDPADGHVGFGASYCGDVASDAVWTDAGAANPNLPRDGTFTNSQNAAYCEMTRKSVERWCQWNKNPPTSAPTDAPLK